MKANPLVRPEMDPDAEQIHEALLGAKVLVVAVVGPPGAGKTALLEATARYLRSKAKLAVIVVNPAAERDADRIARYCDHVEAVRTGAPTAAELWPAIERVDLNGTNYLFIETVGGISGAPDLGQDLTVTMLAVTDGDDKAAEYASLLHNSQALVLSKTSMQQHVTFNREAFWADVRRISPHAALIEVSAVEDFGMGIWLDWLDQRRQDKDPAYRVATRPSPRAEWFVG